MRSPDTVAGVRPWCPGQHLIRPAYAERFAQEFQQARWITNNVGTVDDRRRMTDAVRFAFEEFELFRASQMLRPDFFALCKIACHNALRITDEECMGKARKITMLNWANHVMRHVLLIPDFGSGRSWAGQFLHDP